MVRDVRRQWSVRDRWQLLGCMMMEAEVCAQKAFIDLGEEKKKGVEEGSKGEHEQQLYDRTPVHRAHELGMNDDKSSALCQGSVNKIQKNIPPGFD